MKLRGHHLLCIFGWKGHGYDERFSREMDGVVSDFRDGIEEATVITSSDRLCEACPHLKDTSCFKNDNSNEDKIKAHDERVLGFFGLQVGNKLTSHLLKQLISKSQPHEQLDEICAGCSWLKEDYCYEGLKEQVQQVQSS